MTAIITSVQDGGLTLSRQGDLIRVKDGDSREVSICTVEQLPNLRGLIDALIQPPVRSTPQ